MEKGKRRLRVRKDDRGEWRWQVTSANERIVAAASEGFSSRRACLKNFKRTHEVMGLFLDEVDGLLAGPTPAGAVTEQQAPAEGTA